MMDNTLLLYVYLLMSGLSVLLTYLTYLIKGNDGIRRLFMLCNITILVYGSIRLHSFWHMPLWGQWLLSFMIPLAIYALFGLLILLIDVMMTRHLSVVSDDIMRSVTQMTSLFTHLKEDFWTFIQFCIIDDNDESTKQLFNIG